MPIYIDKLYYKPMPDKALPASPNILSIPNIQIFAQSAVLLPRNPSELSGWRCVTSERWGTTLDASETDLGDKLEKRVDHLF